MSRNTNPNRDGYFGRSITLVLLVHFGFLSPPLLAQPPAVEPDFPLPFLFAPPGAKSTALGGAFVGLADDATAASANPAGLVFLREPQVSANLRLSHLTPTKDQSIFAGSPRTSLESEDLSLFPSFVSFAAPLGRKRAGSRPPRGAWSVSYQQQVSFSGAFEDFSIRNGNISGAVEKSIDLLVDHLALAAAANVAPRLALGVTVRLVRTRLRAATHNLRNDLNEESSILEYNDDLIDDEDQDLTVSLGLLLRPLDKLSVGVVYRQGGEFELQRADTVNINLDPIMEDTFFGLPDSYALGIAVRPTGRWTFLFDVVHLEYTDLLGPDPSPFLTFLEDGEEYRTGVEYVHLLSSGNPLSVRGGLFLEPDHDLAFELIERDGFLESRDIESEELHVTAGIGVVLRSRYQIDFGVDVADSAAHAVVSFMTRL